MNILEKIVNYKIREISLLKERYSFIEDFPPLNTEKHSLIGSFKLKRTINVIAEIKKGSPSKRLFAADLDVISKAKEYALNGASCISVLTDEKFFYGSFETMDRVRKAVDTPILCKDFIIDEFQIKLAKCFGADVVLLIKRILSEERFSELLNCAREYDLEVLVEVDSEEEFNKIKHHDFLLCGVNNRDLSDFSIDLSKTKKLSKLIKKENKFLISESGIYSKEQVLDLRNCHIDGILVGESLIKASDTNLITDLQILKKKTEIKICGINDIETAIHIEKSGADFIGFVFAESKRRVEIETAQKIIKHLNTIKTVGVFLDENPEEILRIYDECDLDFVQVHGNTDLEKLNIPKDRIIPAVTYGEIFLDKYSYILIDGKIPGSGEAYDLSLLNVNSDQKYFLAGGLDCDNVADRVNAVYPNVVDVSSGLETEGVKDLNKITDFINIVGGM